MTTARNALPSKISLTAPPVDLSFSKQSKSHQTYNNEATQVDNKRRTSHHGLYGGRPQSATTPYLITSPPVYEESRQTEPIVERPRRLYRRREEDVDNQDYFKDKEKEDGIHDEENDDGDSCGSWSQAYDSMTLSTIPEVPSTLPGTLTTSAILEIGQPHKRTFGKSVAKTVVDRWKKQSPGSTIVGVYSKNSNNSDNIHVGNEEMRDFHYQQATVLRRKDEKSSGYDRQSSSLSSTSTPDTSSPSSPVDMVAGDLERLASSPSSSKRQRKMQFVLVGVVVVFVVVIVLVAVVVSVVLTLDGHSASGRSGTSNGTMTSSDILNISSPALTSSSASLLEMSTPEYYARKTSNLVSNTNVASVSPTRNSSILSTTRQIVSTRSSSAVLSTTHQIESTLLASSTVSTSSAVSLPSTSSSTQSQPLVTSLELTEEATSVTTQSTQQSLSTLLSSGTSTENQHFTSGEAEIGDGTSGGTSPKSTAATDIDYSPTTNQSETVDVSQST